MALSVFGIRTKFSLFVCSLLTVVLAATAFIFLRHEEAALEKALVGRGSALAGYFAASCEEWLATDDDIGLFTTLRAIEREEGITDAIVVGEEGTIRAHRDPARMGQRWQDPPSIPVASRPPVVIRRLPGSAGDYLLIAQVTERGTSRVLGTVVLRLSRNVIDEALREGRRSALILGLGSLACGLIGAVILVTFILRPVGLLTRGAEAIGRGDLASRIEVVSRDEIGSLAATFNDMAAQLEVAQLEQIEREKVQQELRIAHQIQEALLPASAPDVEELDITSFYKAATEVGGDYYDFVEPSRGFLGVIVADVSGKGVPGSLVMTMVRSVMRSIAGGVLSPRDVLAGTNRMIINDMKPGMFVTAQYCLFDLAERQFSLASAIPLSLPPRGWPWDSTGG
jgi:HAMP domain-containing protein